MLETTYPGVYVEELNSLSLSIMPNATAVPAFAVGNDNTDFTETTVISSWMDYSNKAGEFSRGDLLDACLRTYYENGGGRCYLIPVEKLVDEVPKFGDITLLVAAGQNIVSAVSMLCKAGSALFAILDGPQEDLGTPPPTEPSESPEPEEYCQPELDQTAIRATGSPITEYAATYYPWLRAPWSDLDIPPSATMAGVYNTVDLTRGVWKAPANVSLHGGVLPKYIVTDELQGRYTKGGNILNMIRMFESSGPTVWGARTRQDSDLWRYVSVRRLFNSAERDIKLAMKAAMYEPNSQPTWEQTRAAINSYLFRLWRQGGLAGATQGEAYFVKVGKGVTMTQEDIDNGQMIVQVGMAAVRPAEFIVLQFTQDVNQ